MGNPFRSISSGFSSKQIGGAFFKRSINPRNLTYDTLLTGMPAPGLNVYGAASKDVKGYEEDKAKADALVQGKQAEFEASVKAGQERLALKRKKGFGASMIVNPTLGSTSTLGS